MTIISRVSAELKSRDGTRTLRITPTDLMAIKDAPEFFMEDPLYDLLVSEGSLEAVRTVEQKKRLESDPVSGHDASGRRVREKTTATPSAKATIKRASADTAAPDATASISEAT